MATSDETGGGAGRGAKDTGRPRRTAVTLRWIQQTQETNRVAFELEMKRRRQAVDREFRRFWRARHTPH